MHSSMSPLWLSILKHLATCTIVCCVVFCGSRVALLQQSVLVHMTVKICKNKQHKVKDTKQTDATKDKT